MKTPDLDRIRSEESRTLDSFLIEYNTNLPEGFPPASLALLTEFQTAYPGLFKAGSAFWSLGQHRKHVMDWLAAKARRSAQEG